MDNELEGRLRRLEAGVQRIGELLEQQGGQQRQMVRMLEEVLALMREPDGEGEKLHAVLAQLVVVLDTNTTTLRALEKTIIRRFGTHPDTPA